MVAKRGNLSRSLQDDGLRHGRGATVADACAPHLPGAKGDVVWVESEKRGLADGREGLAIERGPGSVNLGPVQLADESSPPFFPFCSHTLTAVSSFSTSQLEVIDPIHTGHPCCLVEEGCRLEGEEDALREVGGYRRRRQKRL